MKLSDALTGITKLGLDTAPIIYFITNSRGIGRKV
jgi:hypothetical protein